MISNKNNVPRLIESLQTVAEEDLTYKASLHLIRNFTVITNHNKEMPDSSISSFGHNIMCGNMDVPITAVGAGFIPARQTYQWEGISPARTVRPLGGT